MGQNKQIRFNQKIVKLDDDQRVIEFEQLNDNDIYLWRS